MVVYFDYYPRSGAERALANVVITECRHHECFGDALIAFDAGMPAAVLPRSKEMLNIPAEPSSDHHGIAWCRSRRAAIAQYPFAACLPPAKHAFGVDIRLKEFKERSLQASQ